MKILIISNGNGEDLIACNLIKTLPKKTIVTAMPLVGQGKAYTQLGITPIFKNFDLPSGGFIRTVNDLLIDIKAGLLKQHWKQRKLLKNLIQQHNLTLCIGDIFCLIMGSLKNRSNVYFFPTAKSDLFMKHSFVEKWLMKTLAKAVFPRDKLTHSSIQKENIKTLFFGNPMMDNLSPTGLEFPIDNNKPVLAIVPGSRSEAYKNIAYILETVTCIFTQNQHIQYLLSLAPTLALDELVKHTRKWHLTNEDTFHTLVHPNGCKIILSTAFTDVIHQADCVLGLAGTANEQAVEIGKRVFCFEGFGPQSTALRFQEQSKLLSPYLYYIAERKHDSIAKTLIRALEESANQTKKPLLKQKASNQNVSKQITDYILKDFNQ